MRALHIRSPMAYLAGVLNGDGFLTHPAKKANGIFGLRVADKDFSQAFCDALREGCDLQYEPRRDERGYWLVRAYNRAGRFNDLRSLVPTDGDGRRAWLRGLFDSEGNAQLTPLPKRGPFSCVRRVSMYSTNEATLAMARALLKIVGLPTRTRATRPSAGHKGALVVYELCLRGSVDTFRLFAEEIGSSIARKNFTLAAIVDSYCPDLSAACRRAQLAGAEAKRRKLIAVTLPSVLVGIRDLLARGITPTYRNCIGVHGFASLLGHKTRDELVAMAVAT